MSVCVCVNVRFILLSFSAHLFVACSEAYGVYLPRNRHTHVFRIEKFGFGFHRQAESVEQWKHQNDVIFCAVFHFEINLFGICAQSALVRVSVRYVCKWIQSTLKCHLLGDIFMANCILAPFSVLLDTKAQITASKNHHLDLISVHFFQCVVCSFFRSAWA